MNSSQSPSTNHSSSTTITDLNADSLAHCASYLSIQDISNMAMTCQYLNRVAYSDSIWQHCFRERWPQVIPFRSGQMSGAREAFLARHTALRKFEFVDPLVQDFYTHGKPFDHVLLDKNDIIYSQGPLIKMLKIKSFLNGRDSLLTLSDHNARITCMRLFPLNETSLFRSEAQSKESVLVSSSCDHSIRLWWKGACQRCFKGHNGPVSTLSDKLLGDGSSKLLASGGEDCTVRLWSISSSGKRGQHALKATLYGHQRPIKLMSVAGHKSSLLVTISKDSKVRVWDTATSSAVRSSCCVGMTSVVGSPVDMKCHESFVYVAAGPSVVIIDLRTMQKVMTTAICLPKIHSFVVMPSKSLICTGGVGKAMLWDIRRSQDVMKPQPVAELEGHVGKLTLLHMDPYKIITGGPEDFYINIWETDTASQSNSLTCCFPEGPSSGVGCTSMAVNGYRFLTASNIEDYGLIRLRDYSNATHPVARYEDKPTSKFWNRHFYSDSDDTDE